MAETSIRRVVRRVRSELRILTSGGRGTEVTYGGQNFFLSPESADAAVPAYEAEKFHAVIDAAKPGETVFDVGGHHGLYALALAAKVGSTGRVICFEPCPLNRAILLRNVALNSTKGHIVVEPLAVGETDGEAVLRFDPEDLTSSTLNSVEYLGRSVRVQVVPLDRYCRTNSVRPSLVKLDVEGHELAALRGMRDVLATYRPQVHIEVHTGPVFGGGATPQQIAEIVKPLGFETVRWDGAQLTHEEWHSSGHVVVITT